MREERNQRTSDQGQPSGAWWYICQAGPAGFVMRGGVGEGEEFSYES